MPFEVNWRPVVECGVRACRVVVADGVAEHRAELRLRGEVAPPDHLGLQRVEEGLHMGVVAGAARAGALPHALRRKERAQRLREVLGPAVAVEDEAWRRLATAGAAPRRRRFGWAAKNRWTPAFARSPRTARARSPSSRIRRATRRRLT